MIDCRDLGEGEAITLERLERYGEKVREATFSSSAWGGTNTGGQSAISAHYPCLDDAVLEHILQGSYKGIGFDVIGLDPIADEDLTRHKKLFRERIS